MPKKATRLQFTKEELEAEPALKKAAQKASKAADKLDQAKVKLPNKTVLSRKFVIDEKSGVGKVKLSFDKATKPTPTSMPKHIATKAPKEIVVSTVHQKVSEYEDENVGIEGVHHAEQLAEGGAHTMNNYAHARKLKPYRAAAAAEKSADRANLSALYQQAQVDNPHFTSNPYSRWQQKRAIKKAYAEAKRSGETTVSAAKVSERAAKASAQATKKTVEFVKEHKTGILISAGVILALLIILTTVSSLITMMQGGSSSIAISTYPNADSDMIAAEAQYTAMEADLQSYLDNYESTHSYDEYHYDLDSIEHDPYVLISMLTALHGEWTIGDVSATLQDLFDRQYILTEDVTVERRTRVVESSYIDDDGNEVDDSYEEEYDYYICTVTLENFNLSHVPVYMMSQDQLSMYAMYMATLGNRPDLFPDSGYVNRYYGTERPVYEIPPEALSDETFAGMMQEAQKYIGYPYVWGGSSPSTSFDCSGYVSWVINHSGWDVGRLGAQGLYNICTPVTLSNAKPGDLVFFVGTYDTPGVSHVGIYVGNNMMLHCGDPIQYADLTQSYWQAHLYAYGRLPGN